MRTETTTRNLYQYAELSDAAKEKAREWWQELERASWRAEYEPFTTAAPILGITLDDDGIMYSGFWSQGDGASFTGSYEYRPDALSAIKAEFGTDETLHGIAADLDALKADQGRFLVTRPWGSHYSHSNTMDVDFDWDYAEDGKPEPSAETVEALRAILRRFADWIYDELEEQYEYAVSDESAADAIEANEYEFTEAGEIA